MKLPECEIERNAPLTAKEKALGGLGLISFILGLMIVGTLCGCKAFYENSGSSVKVGTLTAPIEVSDGTDSFTAKLLYSMDGASVYTRKDSKVTVRYDNVYTNTYIGCINTRGEQHLQVDVEPLYVGEECETNAVPSGASSESSASTLPAISATASSTASPSGE